MRLGIVGSRRRATPKDKEILRKKVQMYSPEEIVTGGCPLGADKFAEELAQEFNIPIKIFRPEIKPEMDYYARVKEYYRRNEQIAKYSDMLVALVAPDRKGGTENTIGYAKKFKKGVIIA